MKLPPQEPDKNWKSMKIVPHDIKWFHSTLKPIKNEMRNPNNMKMQNL